MVPELVIRFSSVVDGVISYADPSNWWVTFRTRGLSRSVFLLKNREIEHLIETFSSKKPAHTLRGGDGEVSGLPEAAPDPVEIRPGLSARLNCDKEMPLVQFKQWSHSLELPLEDIFAVARTVEFMKRNPKFPPRFRAHEPIREAIASGY